LCPEDLCQPTLHQVPFTRDGWLFELKHDGFRAFARKDRTGVQLLSRWGRSMADAFPEIVSALNRVHADVVLDGELVVPDLSGRSDFEEVRRRNVLQRPRMIAESAARRPPVLIVFDVLELDGEDLRERPLFERREALHAHVAPMRGLQIIEHIETHGEALFRAIAAGDHEGIVAKRLDAPYRAGRHPSWIKIKNREYSRRGAVEWQG
jgi:bifunctional non-homologous end joining protein LigD